MDNVGFELPVNFKGKDLEFPARLLQFGYSYKIEVEINDSLVLFEPDEERNWRAVADPEQQDKTKTVNLQLLKAIASSLEAITK